MEEILILTDYSRQAEQAAEVALEVAGRSRSDLVLSHALVLPENLTGGGYEQTGDVFRRLETSDLGTLKAFAARLKRKVRPGKAPGHLPVIRCLDQPGSAAGNFESVIHRRKQIWLVVMPEEKTQGSIISQFIFASGTFMVTSMARCPVLLIPPGTLRLSVRTILFASDLENADYKPLRQLARFARLYGARIVVTHMPSVPRTEPEEADRHQTFRTIVRKVGYPNIRFDAGPANPGNLGRLVLDTAPDLLAMVNRKHPYLEAVLHRSSTDRPGIPLLILPADNSG